MRFNTLLILVTLICCANAEFQIDIESAHFTILENLTGSTVGDDFGRSVAFIGDINGDGYPDAVVGAPMLNSIVVLLLDGNMTVKESWVISGDQIGLSNSTGFGASVVGVGDINNDDIPDIAIGFPTSDSVVFLSLNTDSSITSYILLYGSAGSSFGGSMSFLIQDDNPTLVVGAFTESSQAGCLYFYNLIDFIETSKFCGEGTSKLGYQVQAIGDLDGDGNQDIAVVLGNYSTAIYYLSSNFSVISKVFLQSTSNMGTGQLGFSLASLGDINGDNIPDISIAEHTDGTTPGSFWICLMKRNGEILSSFNITNGNGFLSKGNNTDSFASSLDAHVVDNRLTFLAGAMTFNTGNVGAVWTIQMNITNHTETNIHTNSVIESIYLNNITTASTETSVASTETSVTTEDRAISITSEEIFSITLITNPVPCPDCVNGYCGSDLYCLCPPGYSGTLCEIYNANNGITDDEISGSVTVNNTVILIQDVTINGNTNISSSSISLGSDVIILGNLSVSDSTILFTSLNPVLVSGCLYLSGNSSFVYSEDIKQQISQNTDQVTLIATQCVVGDINALNDNSCEDGYTETYSISNEGLSVAFGNCFDPLIIIIVIGSIIVLIILILALILLTPLKEIVFPYRRTSRSKIEKNDIENKLRCLDEEIKNVNTRVAALSKKLDP
eukprot:TRINITY_DN3352_c0_g1_i1.p1 TRINITY_DN3352_c0_g1~~TRINITY_DN3352_c0_g1_i1.p1  ORF type:complete len:713 (+),score=132.07 TRINITY_DN3352_c0_g1_i1:126-2141(+)